MKNRELPPLRPGENDYSEPTDERAIQESGPIRVGGLYSYGDCSKPTFILVYSITESTYWSWPPGAVPIAHKELQVSCLAVAGEQTYTWLDRPGEALAWEDFFRKVL